VTLTIWSDYRGKKEVLDLIEAIRAALHRQRPASTDGAVLRTFVENAEARRDVDGVTYMGSVTVRAITQQT
jgi:hypothetical protein